VLTPTLCVMLFALCFTVDSFLFSLLCFALLCFALLCSCGCIQILEKGSLQVSARERDVEQKNKAKDVANIIASKCISTETKKPFPVRMVCFLPCFSYCV
jgi:hypothetical protein